MNGKKAKELRRNAKYIYDVQTAYNDINYKVDEWLVDPLTGIKEENPSFFMDGSLARRTLKQGTTRKMIKDLKKGIKNRITEFKPKTNNFYNCRSYR